MSFYDKQLQVILQIYLSGNLSPFSEVYLYLKFTVTGQFVLTVCAFHGYALAGVLFENVMAISVSFISQKRNDSFQFTKHVSTYSCHLQLQMSFSTVVRLKNSFATEDDMSMSKHVL